MEAGKEGSREGSLEAPVRHPLGWKDPSFYDEENLFADPQIHHREMIAEVPHPTIGTLRLGGLPIGHWEVAASALELGRALDALGREDEAERFLTESHRTLLDAFGPDDRRTDEARSALRDHLLRRGLDERAAATRVDELVSVRARVT